MVLFCTLKTIKFVPMKYSILLYLLFLVLSITNLHSQTFDSCGDNSTIKISGDYNYIDLVECSKDAEITNDGEDTMISNILLIDDRYSISFKPKDSYVIRILPPKDSVDNDDHSGKSLVERRTVVTTKAKPSDKGNEEDTPVKSQYYITIFPNPVDDILTIESESNIISYYIRNAIGTTLLSGTNNINNTISVNNLTSGLYYLSVVTDQNTVIKKQFLKN